MTPSIRPLGPEHGDACLSVGRACRIQADFEFYFDRSPEFWAWTRAVFDDVRYVGAFEGEELLGYAMVGMNLGWVDGAVEPVFYLGDARVLPSARGRQLSRRLGLALFEGLPESWRVGFGLIKRGNVAAVKALDTLENAVSGLSVTRLCGFEAHGFVPLGPLLGLRSPFRSRWSDRPPGYEVLPIDRGHIDALARHLVAAGRQRLFSPWVDEERARQRLSRSLEQEGLTWLWLLHRGRRLGALRLWDASAIRRMTITGYSPTGLLARRVLSMARWAFPELPAPPATGEALRLLDLSCATVPGLQARALVPALRHATRVAGARGVHLVSVSGAEGDERLRWLRRRPNLPFHSDIHLFCRHGPRPENVEDPWLDAAAI